MNLPIILLICYLAYDIHEVSSDSCGNPDHFYISFNKLQASRSTYLVSIESSDIQTFTSFSITAEPEGGSPGNFQLTSGASGAAAQFHPNDINTITERDDSPKESINVLWITSSAAGRNCAMFKATVSYRDGRKTCTQKLTRPLCVSNEQPSSVADGECCARDEATYTMTFQGLWPKETDAKNFPAVMLLTHFSDVLGATHSKNLTMWAEGQYASDGLRQFAVDGSLAVLESELREHENDLKSVTKIPSAQDRKTSSNITAKFQVDQKHNLLSVASILRPSPDWFTGISKLDLCTKSCSWVENKVVDLALYDAGIYSEHPYVSSEIATDPQEKVHRLVGRNENAVKPIARLYLKRENIIAKPRAAADDQRYCRTTEWSEWSQCTPACGSGTMTRARRFIQNSKSVIEKCAHVSTVEKKQCMGPPCTRNLRVGRKERMHCTTTEWSDWSPCSATCGEGVSIRSRELKSLQNLPYVCVNRNKIPLVQRKDCFIKECKVDNEVANEICQLPVDEGFCRGYFPRYYFDSEKDQCTEFIYGGCGGNQNNFFSFDECKKNCTEQYTNLL